MHNMDSGVGRATSVSIIVLSRNGNDGSDAPERGGGRIRMVVVVHDDIVRSRR